jgi:hypothetical protein
MIVRPVGFYVLMDPIIEGSIESGDASGVPLRRICPEKVMRHFGVFAVSGLLDPLREIVDLALLGFHASFLGPCQAREPSCLTMGLEIFEPCINRNGSELLVASGVRNFVE